MRREIRDQGKLFSARHRRFCGKARAGTSVLWHPWFGWAIGLAPFLAHPPQTPLSAKTKPPICVGSPACGVDSSAADVRTHIPHCLHPTPRQSLQVPRSSSHRLLHHPSGLHQGVCECLMTRPVPVRNSDGRAGPNSYGRPDQWGQGAGHEPAKPPI